MKAVYVLTRLLTAAWAQPMEGRWSPQPMVQQPRATPRRPVNCPGGSYRKSLVLWHCTGTGGRVFFYMRPNEEQAALEIPEGTLDVSINASAEVDATLLLADAGTDGHVFITPSGTSRIQKTYKQMQITVTVHPKGSPGTDTLRIKGTVTTPLLLKFKSHTDKWRTMTLDYLYQGIDPCTQPDAGCTHYDQSAAVGEIKKWSNWMRMNHADPEQAWNNIARPFSEGSVVPWYRWSAIWAQWPNSKGHDSWQEAFQFLDITKDAQISFEEFRNGWKLGDGTPLVADQSSPPVAPVVPAPAPSPPSQSAGQQGPQPRSNLEESRGITPGATHEISKGGGGGMPNFMPVWLIWAVPLLALACLCVRFFVRDPVKPYNMLPKSEPLNRTPQAAAADRWNQEYSRQPAGVGPPTAVLSPQDKIVAPGGGATQKEQPPPEAFFASRTVRACDEGWARLGLMDCGLRGSKNMGGKQTKVGMREPERQGQVLPPVLAWRGPDESQEDDEIRDIIRAMRSEPRNEFVQESSCERLEDMALNPCGRKKIAEHGGITEIVRAMNTHPLSAPVQENGCGALGNEALSSERFQKIIAQEGGIEAILQAMREHQLSAAVQEKACWALQQLAMTQDNRHKISREHGVDLIAAAMLGHFSSEAVQEHGCMALGNLAYDVDTRKDIVTLGAMDAMVKAMNQFPHVKVLQENACFALHNLACSDEAMEPIITAGGIQAIINAMKEHRDEPGVLENAINALHNINCGPIRFVYEVVNLDGITYICSAMHSHSVAGLQAKACHVLGQLGDRDEEVRRRIQEKGGFEYIDAAQARFPNSKEVQHAAREARAILNS